MVHFVECLGSDDIDMAGEPESFVELDVGRKILLLRHEGGGCHLLNGAGRCSEYAARPAACAAYPYAFSDGLASGQSRKLFVLPDSPCGEPASSPGAVAADAVTCVEAELNEYFGLVRDWNRMQKRRRLAGHRPKSLERLVDFLIARTAGSRDPSNQA